MATDELRDVLDRELAKELARDVIELASPLLVELVNHGCWAFRRCQLDSREENVDLAPFALYRQILELVDGAQVLVSQGCSIALIPLLRSVFEAAVSLEFILRDESEYRQRSLSWLHSHILGCIEQLSRLDPDTDSGGEFRAAFEADQEAPYDFPEELLQETRRAVDRYRRVLKRGELEDISRRYERLRAKGRKPKWYQLSGGASNLRELSNQVGRASEYDFFYRKWSGLVHAVQADSFLGKASELAKQGPFARVRTAKEMPSLAHVGSGLMLRSTRLMVAKFRPGEDLGTWYAREVQERHSRLRELGSVR